MFFQLYRNREGHSDDPKPMFERNRFYLRYQAPIATRKKKKSVQCWKEPKWFLETETQINKSQLKATGRTWTLLGQYYCLQSSVILSSKKKLLDFLRSHGSLVTTETNKIQTRSCFVSEMPEDHTWWVLQLISWATTGTLQNVSRLSLLRFPHWVR